MRKIFKGILSLGLAVAVGLGVTAFYGGAEYTVAEAAYTTSASTYYNGITATSGNSLLGQLHDLITTTHKYYTSYGECSESQYVNVTDPGPNGGALEFYTQQSIMSFSGNVGNWNREHVWCKSLSNGMWTSVSNSTRNGGADMHHIRPSESGLNSTRGSYKFGEVNGGKEAWSRNTSGQNVALGGHVGGGTFEPLDNVKGDVARIVMYVYTHYNTYSNVGGTTNGDKSGIFGTLNFTHIMAPSSEAAAKKMLLEWNELDPVDNIERTRNEEVAKIQGNRNPFIDNESYAEAIWGDGISIDPPPSNTLTSLSLNPKSFTLSVGGTQNLTVTPTPSNASASVTWTSSDSSVATVSGGKVTAKAAGTATITATSTSNTSIKATATVTVKASSSTETNTGKVTITRQESFKSNLSGYGLYDWSSGGVSGVAYIYGSKKDGLQFNTSKASQYLASTTPTSGAIKKVTISGSGNSAWTLFTSNQPYDEIENGNPSNGTPHGTASGNSWTVSGNEKYFALVLGGGGAAYLDSIEVEYGSGGGSDVTDEELEEIILSPSEFTMDAGTEEELTVISIPSTASAEVTWTSSNPSVATVNQSGKVTALKAGTATITATCKSDSSIRSSAVVTVTAVHTGDDEVDYAKIQAFRNAVEAIDGSGALGEWRDAINAAIVRYRALSAAEEDACEGEIDILYDQIESYNERIGGYNRAAESAEEAALKGAGRML